MYMSALEQYEKEQDVRWILWKRRKWPKRLSQTTSDLWKIIPFLTMITEMQGNGTFETAI